MFSEGFSYTENSVLCTNLTLENSPSTPTPPQSPESKTDVFLGYEIPFSNVDMVDPNAVLDESHLFSHSTGLNFSFPNLNSTEISLKRENWEPFLSEDFLAPCPHEFVKNFCNKCFSDSFKTEILNDCMWTSGCENTKLDRLSTSESNDEGTTKCLASQTHLDSVSSRYSEIMDTIDLVSHPENVLDTPSDTTDTDTDLEDTSTAAVKIHLEHNYHFSSNSASPLRKSFDKQERIQEIDLDKYSDDEITIDDYDSDNSDCRDDSSQDFMPTTTQNLSHNRLKENIIINTTEFQTHHHIERKASSSYISRKVGRPPKNLKRVGNSYPSMKRAGYRSNQMDPEKRKVHNKMERIRRVNLKSDFDNIRKLVPSLVDRVRAPKVLILKSAVELVFELKGEIQKMDIEKLRLSHYNSILKQKFKQLKKEKGITDIELG